MSSPTDNPLVNAFARKYRRKRKFQGATWTPGTVSATPEDGVWCPQHRMRHGYMSKTLGVTFEKGSNGKWKTLWFCAQSGNVLSEQEMSSD